MPPCLCTYLSYICQEKMLTYTEHFPAVITSISELLPVKEDFGLVLIVYLLMHLFGVMTFTISTISLELFFPVFIKFSVSFEIFFFFHTFLLNKNWKKKTNPRKQKIKPILSTHIEVWPLIHQVCLFAPESTLHFCFSVNFSTLHVTSLLHYSKDESFIPHSYPSLER